MNTLPTLLSAMVAFVATFSAVIFIKKFRNNIGMVCAFSAGFFISLCLFELLPAILSLVPKSQIPLEQALFPAIAGFFLLFTLERVFTRFHSKDHNMTRIFNSRIGLLSTLEFCSHGFIEGLAIGVSFQLQFGLGVFVAIAVTSHDFCDGISTLTLMMNSGNSMKSSISMLFVDAIAPVLGVTTAFFLSVGTYFLAFMLSFLAGSFLYIGGGSLLPDAIRMNRPAVAIALFAIGFFAVLPFSAIM